MTPPSTLGSRSTSPAQQHRISGRRTGVRMERFCRVCTNLQLMTGTSYESFAPTHLLYQDPALVPRFSSMFTGRANHAVEWTGIMGYTADRQPIVGEAPGQGGLWICAGFNGHGMALTFQSAEALVQLMMGREEEVDRWLPRSYRLERVPRLTT